MKSPHLNTTHNHPCTVLAGCGVDMSQAYQAAYDICERRNIWSKPLGLFGKPLQMITRYMFGKRLSTACEATCHLRGEIALLGSFPLQFPPQSSVYLPLSSIYPFTPHLQGTFHSLLFTSRDTFTQQI